MTDYERWVQQTLLNIASREKHDKIYKQCAIDEAIARLTNEDISDTLVKNSHRMAQADAERDLFR